MQSVYLLSIAIFGTSRVLGQIATIPACANICVEPLLSGAPVNGCISFDLACYCRSHDTICSVASCSIKACSPADVEGTYQYLISYCGTLGAIVSSNDIADCSSSASSISDGPIATGSPNPTKTPDSITNGLPNQSTTQASIADSSTSTPNSPSFSSTRSSTATGSGSDSTRPEVTTSPATVSHGSNGLPTGAKAGIAIVAILLAVVAALLAFYLLRRRKQKEILAEHDHPIEPESETTQTKFVAQELPEKGEMKVVTIHETPITRTFQHYVDLDAPLKFSGNISDNEMRAIEVPDTGIRREELSTCNADIPTNSHILGVQGNPDRSEVHQRITQASDIEARNPQSPQDGLIPQIYNIYSLPELVGEDSITTSSPTAATELAASGNSSRLEALKAQREKIKVEKERLMKLKELEEREATVHREIMEEERRRNG